MKHRNPMNSSNPSWLIFYKLQVYADNIISIIPLFPNCQNNGIMNGQANANAYVMSRPNSRGANVLSDPMQNKGSAFNVNERLMLGIHGLLPPAVFSAENQVKRCIEIIRSKPTDLDRYMYLATLQDYNETLFYMVVTQHVVEMMPLIYTPVVGSACQNYGMVRENPRGLFISIHDKGHISDVLKNWPEKNIKAICVTDGERILGLGDLGVFGMGIPVGKLSLYTALAGVHPSQCLPITLDVGTENKAFLENSFYYGLKRSRTRGKDYDNFMDEFMQACVQCYGTDVLIQFEDFGNQNAFRLLEKYRHSYCTFNDDIQGTASVCVAGILAASRDTGKKLNENVFLFQGAGEASLGIADLLILALRKSGLTEANAKARVFLLDSRGLIVQHRPKGGLTKDKERFAHDRPPIDTLAEAVEQLKPTMLIGAAAVPGAFTPEILQTMARLHSRPVIFALSNPTSKAECTAEQAYANTEGRCIFASGSPFDPVTLGGQTFHPGQGNNAYIFPGLGLAVTAGRIHPLVEELFLVSAETLANQVTSDDFKVGRLYPPLTKIRQVSLKIATAVLEYAYKHKLAYYWPEPRDKEAFLASQMYSPEYNDVTSTMKEVNNAYSRALL